MFIEIERGKLFRSTPGAIKLSKQHEFWTDTERDELFVQYMSDLEEKLKMLLNPDKNERITASEAVELFS